MALKPLKNKSVIKFRDCRNILKDNRPSLCSLAYFYDVYTSLTVTFPNRKVRVVAAHLRFTGLSQLPNVTTHQDVAKVTCYKMMLG